VVLQNPCYMYTNTKVHISYEYKYSNHSTTTEVHVLHPGTLSTFAPWLINLFLSSEIFLKRHIMYMPAVFILSANFVTHRWNYFFVYLWPPWENICLLSTGIEMYIEWSLNFSQNSYVEYPTLLMQKLVNPVYGIDLQTKDA